MTRILVTGAGGPAAVSFIKALPETVEVFMADMDPCAAGLYLVPERRRVLVPAAMEAHFVGRLLELCVANRIDVLVPTVDAELLPIAEARGLFRKQGTRVLLAQRSTLALCLDKWRLAEHVGGHAWSAETRLLDGALDPTAIRAWPVVAKPRSGSGSRGVRICHTLDELTALPRDGSYIIQEMLPGAEYSVDVLVHTNGHLLGAVCRERLKIDSGVAVTSRTVHDAELAEIVRQVVEVVGVELVANVQFRRRADGSPALLEINPRFPGTMALTVAAGINMPTLALRQCLGECLSSAPMRYRELAMTRVFEEHFFPVSALAALERSAGSKRDTSLPLAA